MFCFKKRFQTQDSFSQAGITIIDLVVAVGIFAIIIGMALPKFTDLKLSYERYYGRRNFESTILKAKTKTLEWGARGIVTFTDGGNRLTYGLDFIPYSGDFVADKVLFSNDLPSSVSMELADGAFATKIVFDSRGFIINPLTGLYYSPKVRLNQGGVSYCQITLYAAGSIEFLCD